MIARVQGGEEVKILTSGGEIDPNTYNVQFVKRDLVGLACKETGITIKVNNQRIYKIINQEKKMNNDSNIATIDETTATIEAPELTIDAPEIISETSETEKQEKPKAKKKVKAPPEPIDFDSMINDGLEVWTKGGLSLGDDPKVSAISVAAHCAIDPEGTENRGYVVFNSYNGTWGAKGKGKGGKRYDFTEKMTVEKKRKLLEKKGYVKHEA